MGLRRRVTAPDGSSISYLVHGEGEPTLVLIPGLLQSAARWEELGYLARFSATGRVLAIDLLGHGESDGPTDPAAYAPEAVVAHVVAVLEAEDVSAALIWGYADGAETALLTARRRPDVFIGVVLGGMYLGDISEGMRELGVDAAALIERSAAALEQGDWEAYFDMQLADIPPEVREGYKASNDPAVVAAITRADLLRPRGFLMPSARTLAYWAEDDMFASANARLAESLPIEWAVVPGGHSDGFVLLDRVAAAVEGFIATVIRA